MGEAIVAKVRSVTRQPITHVVLSHWHGDHMRGLQAIRAAFPGVQILAHPHTRDEIVATQERWLKRRVSDGPEHPQGVEARDRERPGHERPAADRGRRRRGWRPGSRSTEQLDRENHLTTYVVPDATFEDASDAPPRRPRDRFLRLGNAHTAGDVILWLPAGEDRGDRRHRHGARSR